MDQINRTRAERAVNVDRWADRVKPEDLKDANPEVSREILELLDECAEEEELIADAPGTARPQQRDSA